MTTFNQMNLRQNDDGIWYIDSGAAAHVTSDAGKFSHLTPYTGNGTIVIGDGSHHPISHTGNVSLSLPESQLPLSNVLLTPAIQKNILSVSKLVDETNSSVEFTPSVYLKDLHTKKTLAKGERRGNMYVFEESHVPLKTSSSVAVASSASSFPTFLSRSTDHSSSSRVLKLNKPDLWHLRLGHCSQVFLDKLSAKGLIPAVSLESKCPSCHLCKSHVLPFHSINKRATKPFEIICSDVWGPAPTASLSGSRYYVLFLDSYTRFSWIYFMKNKHEVFKLFKQFHALVQNQFNTNVVYFQCDGGRIHIP